MGQSAERVFQIVKTIEEIAFQTNILALNAGVEAVRAGEQGKEFVLVVEEIRNLSQRCSQVARETSKMLTENSRQANEGLRLSEETGKVLGATLERAGKVAGLLAVMEEGLESQSRGLREVHSILGGVEKDAFRNSGMGEKTMAAGSALAKQMQTLKGLSGQLSDLVKGSKPAARPTGIAKEKVLSARALSLSTGKETAAEASPSLEELDHEKTGTEGAKVISLKG
jgi:methyl-accepting chemotaxis protein